MARPKLLRNVAGCYRGGCTCHHSGTESTHPVPMVTLLQEEVEAIKLADIDGLSQEEAGRMMNVSRATFGRILERARQRLALALVSNLRIVVSPDKHLSGEGESELDACSQRSSEAVSSTKGDKDMEKIAIATNDGKTVSGHVGRTRGFAIYKIEANAATFETNLSNTFTQHHREDGSMGQGFVGGQGHGHGIGSQQGQGESGCHGAGGQHGSHGGLIAALKSAGVKTLICRGMGPRMVEDLRHNGMIPVICGEELVEDAAAHFAQGMITEGASECDH